MRLDPFRFLGGVIGLAQLERGPVIDRGQPARELDLALDVELLRTLVAGIDPIRRPQRFKGCLVAIEPGRLALLAIPCEA